MNASKSGLRTWPSDLRLISPVNQRSAIAMNKFFKWLFRLTLALSALVIVIVVVALLSYNSILRNIVQRSIRAQTGLDAEVGQFKLGLVEPTLEIRNLKIFNPPDYGGTPFLNISEIHVEYDRAALAKKIIHVTLIRFNLGELDIVKNQNGQTNIFAFGAQLPPKKTGAPAVINFRQQTGCDFEGIDQLKFSFGKAKFIDLQNPQNNREQMFGMQNCVVPNVKSANDLAGLATLIYLRSDGFFNSLTGPQIPQNGNSAPLQSILNFIGVTF